MKVRSYRQYKKSLPKGVSVATKSEYRQIKKRLKKEYPEKTWIDRLRPDVKKELKKQKSTNREKAIMK